MTAATGLIVGSGLAYLDVSIDGRQTGTTPFGNPSSDILSVRFGGRPVLCIARHGEQHRLAPHVVNYRANAWALKQLGVERVVAINTVGAIAADFEPGQLAVPAQLIDYTWGRPQTLCDAPGMTLEHVDFTLPFEPALRRRVLAAVAEQQDTVHEGVYGVVQGPRLETAAEIGRLERDGCTMVGMTAMPEAALARELGIAYATVAVAVNHAAGRSPDGGGIHEQLERHSRGGMRRVRDVLERLLAALEER